MSSATATERVFNFSPGPAVMPLSVLEQAQRELVCLPGYGMSVLEMSHRSEGFLEILATAKRLLKELLAIPDNYKIIFLQGGSRLQFSMVPLNLMRGQAQPPDYLVTGSWSKMALDEAKREGKCNVAWDGKATNFDRLPKAGEAKTNPSASYLYYCSNETIQGVQFQAEPESRGAPLVCDASSDIFSRPTDFSKFALVYAGAQKNLGPSGVTVVVIREDLLARSKDTLPAMLNYKTLADNGSLYNTPPTFGIYILRLVLKWLVGLGGLAAVGAINERKARTLYAELDRTDFWRPHAEADSRSLMNVTFRLPSEDLEKLFIKEATAAGFDGLKGHRSVGGLRASIYNAFPEQGITDLVQFMQEFEKKKG
jgi:phosphoserine aminotransferase